MWTETSKAYLDTKTGDLFHVMCDAVLAADESQVVVATNVTDGEIWVFPSTEFYSDRFVPVQKSKLREMVDKMLEW